MNPDFLYLHGYSPGGIKPTLSLSTLNSTGDGTTATFTGEILTGDLITESGFCWNFLPNPTINNFKQPGGPTITGPLVLDITSNLNKSTTYFVRAYAIDSGGIGYSNELYFTTLPTTVLIDSQTWNTKNEDRTTYRDGTVIPEFVGTNADWNLLTTGAWCYYGKTATITPDPSIGIIYGKLYNWYAVMGITTTESNPPTPAEIAARLPFAPSGYHVPTSPELSALRTYLGGVNLAGSALKEVGNSHFITGNADATNSSGFTFLPGGQRDTSFDELYFNGGIWSSTLSDSVNAVRGKVENDLTSFALVSNPYSYGRSVRLMQDLAPPEAFIYTATSGDNGTFATFTGAIAGLGISVSGFCWATQEIPTTANSKTTNGGTTPGNISGIATLLNNDTFYFVRAYATNSTATVYSDVITFETNPVKIDIEEIKIGTQVWAKKNLDTVSYLGSGVPIPTAQYRYYDNDPGNGSIYGLLYTVAPARNTSLPPQGWRVPSSADFSWLREELLGETLAGGPLKQTGDLTIGNGLWASPNTGATNSTDWTGLPGGSYTGTTFINKGLRGNFWTTQFIFSAYTSYYLTNNGTAFTDQNIAGGNFVSIRLIKNIIALFNNDPVIAITPTQISITTNFIPETRIAVLKDTGVCWSTSPNPTIADSKTVNPVGTTPIAPNPATTIITNEITGLTQNVDYYVRAYYTEAAIGLVPEQTYYGFNNFFTAKLNTFTGVRIETQIWQSKNCDHLTYSDGTVIPEFVGTSAQWANQTLGRWCNVSNDPANTDVYGRLYNWQAVAGIWNTASINDPLQRKSFAPDGWRVPEIADFTTLINNLPYGGGTTYAGVKLRETGQATWVPLFSVFFNGTNSTGFTARGAGTRTSNGFGGIRGSASWWVYTQASSANATWYRVVSNSTSITSGVSPKSTGYSVRLIKI